MSLNQLNLELASLSRPQTLKNMCSLTWSISCWQRHMAANDDLADRYFSFPSSSLCWSANSIVDTTWAPPLIMLWDLSRASKKKTPPTDTDSSGKIAIFYQTELHMKMPMWSVATSKSHIYSAFQSSPDGQEGVQKRQHRVRIYKKLIWLKWTFPSSKLQKL